MRFRTPRSPVLLWGAALFLIGSESLREEQSGTRQIFPVPPYLETFVFDVAGAHREGDLRVVPPDPGLFLAASAGWEELRPGGSMRTVVLRRPAPGRWSLRTSRSARLRPLSQSFSVHGVLLAPEEPILSGDRISFTYQLLDKDGMPLRELAEYPLVLEMDLVKPDGRRARLAIERLASEGPGEIRIRGEVTCDQPGRYWTETVAFTRDVDGKLVTVLRDRWSGFSVASAAAPETPIDSARVFADIEQRVPLTVAPGDRGGVNDR